MMDRVREAERLRKEAQSVALSDSRRADRSIVIKAQRALSNAGISY